MTNGDRNYAAAVQALNSLQSNFAAVEAIRKSGKTSNNAALPAMRDWVRRIGYEPKDFDRLNLIHIAGTKGKGSTSSYISSILAQYLPTHRSISAERVPTSVGLYTSPHLRFVRERIKINNAPISEQLFAKYFWEVWDRLEATSPSPELVEGRNIDGKPIYFHFLTLVALHCYMQEKVGTAVIECGVGGEFDTTNILEKPIVTGVTNLGIDHVVMLGDTIESIAWHKGGIFKPGVPAFTVAQPPSALEVLRQRAAERQTELRVVEEHPALNDIKLGLQGGFQRTNASLAIAICAAHLDRLGFLNKPDGVHSDPDLPPEFVKGLETTRLGGRCDMRPDTQLRGLTWYLDGGHTLESIEVAGRWFASASATPEKSTRILIFNQQTRDARSLARRLHETLSTALSDPHPFTHAIFCTNSTYRDAGYKPDLVSMNTNKDDVNSLRVQRDLAEAWDEIDPKAEVHVLGTIEEAVGKARVLAESGEGRVEVLGTGSLHLVGGLIEVLEGEQETDDGGSNL